MAQLVASLPRDHAVIAGVGATSGALWAQGPLPTHIYNMDFSYPSAVALGLALARPDLTVLAVEGEGSALAGVANLYALARHQPQNLTVVVFDNGVYGTGSGTMTSPSGDGVVIADLARVCGIGSDRIHHLSDISAVRELAAEITRTPRFRFVHAVVDRSDVRSDGRVQVGADFTEAAIQFQMHMRGVYPSQERDDARGERG